MSALLVAAFCVALGFNAAVVVLSAAAGFVNWPSAAAVGFALLGAAIVVGW